MSSILHHGDEEDDHTSEIEEIPEDGDDDDNNDHDDHEGHSENDADEEDEVFAPPTRLRRFFMGVEQLVWSVTVFAIEARMRLAPNDSAKVREYLQVFVPWISMLTIASLGRRYVLRGLDRGPLYKIGLCYYLDQEGTMIRHSFVPTEIAIFVLSAAHMVTTAFVWWQSINNKWGYSPVPFDSVPMICAALVLVVVIVDVVYYSILHPALDMFEFILWFV